MKVLISAPTGYNTRELLLPLKAALEADGEIDRVVVVTPGAPYREILFPTYGGKFDFAANPSSLAGHEELLREQRPDVLVTPTAGLDTHDVPLLQAARALGIPTVTFVSSWDNIYKMERLKQHGLPHVLADRIAVWNQMMHDHLRRVFPELGAERIVITGAPRFDWFTHTERIPTRAQVLEHLGMPADGGKLLHFATTELYPMEYIIRTIYEAQRRGIIPYPLHLYASVHPGGNFQRHENYARRYGVAVRFSFGRRESAPLKEFLYNPTLEETYLLIALWQHTDVLINHSSTVAIESFLADVPVINVKYGQPWDWWRWRRSMVYRDFQQHYADITRGGATTIVGSPRQLVAAVVRYLQYPELERAERAATVRRLVTFTDGRSSERLLGVIKEVCAGL